MTSIDFSPAQSAQEKPAATIFDQLEQRIKRHETIDQDRGLIEKGLSLLYSSDENSLANLKQLRQQAQQVKGDSAALVNLKIEDAIKEDERSTGWQNDISQYGASFIKGVPLFMAKGKGLLLAAGTNGLDQVRTSTSAEQMAVDFTLGAGKGVILKKSIEHFGASSAPMWQKGVTLGGSMSLAETALTSKTWYDSSSGSFHLKEGLGNTALSTTLGAATGAAVFPIGGKILERIGATKIGAETLQNSGLARNIATGGSFGFVSGSVSETVREVQAGERIDPLKIVSRGALQGVVDMGAGAAGHKLSYMGRTGESGRTNFDWSGKTAKNPAETEFAQTRAFKIVGGERALSDALTKVDGNGAAVTVREWLGPRAGVLGLLGFQTFSNPATLHIQNRANGENLGPTADTAKMIAACNLDQIFATKAVMPTGKEVFLHSGKDRIRFSTERPIDVETDNIKHLGRIPADRIVEIASATSNNAVRLELGQEKGNNYAHFYRRDDGSVVVRGRSASEGVWTRAEINKPNFVNPKDVVYFGHDTKMAAHALSHLHLLTPGSAFKVDNRAIGIDYNGDVFITDHGSKDGTYINRGRGRFVELGTEDTMIHLGKFGTILIRQSDGPKVLPPVVPAGKIPAPGTPGNQMPKPGVPPVIAKPGSPNPPVAAPGTPNSPIARPGGVIARPVNPPVIAPPGNPPVIARPGVPPVANPGHQGQFRPAQRPPLAPPAMQVAASDVRPLKNYYVVAANASDYWRGQYADIVLSNTKGVVETPRNTVMPLYETSREARGSAGFIAKMFARVLEDPHTKIRPDVRFDHESVRASDGKTYFVPVAEFANGDRGKIVLDRSTELKPYGFVSNGIVLRISK